MATKLDLKTDINKPHVEAKKAEDKTIDTKHTKAAPAKPEVKKEDAKPSKPEAKKEDAKPSKPEAKKEDAKPSKPEAKKEDAKPAVKTAEEKEKEFLASRMAEVLKKFKNVTPDSIRREVDGHHAGKLTVEITCKNKKHSEDENVPPHECGTKRRVATSDLHQVSLCEDCTAEHRLAKRRKKAKQARIEKRKEAEARGETKPKAAPKLKAPKKVELKVKKAAEPVGSAS